MKKRIICSPIFHIPIILLLICTSLFASSYETYLKNRILVGNLHEHLSLTRNDITIYVSGEIRLILEQNSFENKRSHNQQFYPCLSNITITLPYKDYIFTGSVSKLRDYSHSSETRLYDDERESIEKEIISEHSTGGIYRTSLLVKREFSHFLCTGAGFSVIKEYYNFDKLSYYCEEGYWDNAYSQHVKKNDIGFNATLQLSIFSTSPFFSFFVPLQKEKVFPPTQEAGIFLNDRKAGMVLHYENWKSIHKESNNILQYLIFLRNRKGKYLIEYGLLGQTELRSELSPINGFFAGASYLSGFIDVSLYSQMLFSEYNDERNSPQQIETSFLSLKLSICYHPRFHFEKE